MPSFRNSKEKAQHVVGKLSAIGTARHGNNNDGRIHSLGTARNYQQALTLFNEWLQQTRQGDVASATREQALQYLDLRSGEVRQKTLDMDRQAIQAAMGEKLPVIRSEIETILTTRSYTDAQLQLLMAAQSPRHAFSTMIARAAGLRAHELLTLLPAHERPASTHREWRQDKFAAMGEVSIWTVVGKGGLCREVALSKQLSAELEAKRLEIPVTVKDRGIVYRQQYDISGGRNWSQSFSSASKRALGWSQGGHGGCRHSYAQERLAVLQAYGYSAADAKLLISQSLGHFRGSLVEIYLR